MTRVTLADFGPHRFIGKNREYAERILAFLLEMEYKPEHRAKTLQAMEHHFGLEYGQWQHPEPSVRRLRLLAAPGEATPEQVAARVAFYGGLCWICGREIGNTIDHVKPLSRGGSKWPANLRPACRPCNSQKHDKWPYEVER